MIKKYKDGVIATLNNGRRVYITPDCVLDNGDFIAGYYKNGKFTGTNVVSNIAFTKEGAEAIRQALTEVQQ